MEVLKRKLQGYYQYYAVTDNSDALYRYKEQIERLLFKWLNRRSQRKSFGWDKFQKMLRKYPLPRPKIAVNIFDMRWEISS